MGLFHSSAPLNVGPRLSPSEIATATILPSSLSPGETDHFLETLAPGTVVQRWDFVHRFTPETALRPSEIEPLRRESDELADAVVQQLDLAGAGGKRDALATVEEFLAQRETDLGQEGWRKCQGEDAVWRFWDEMARDPPSGISASGGGEETRYTPLEAFEEALTTPSLAEGQRVFWKYSGQIFIGLMHFSLAGGFSSPKLSSVMRETNYLTSDSREATYKRLLETTLFVLDAMSDMRPISGRGWRSALRVRLLHAQVRSRIARGKGRYNSYDEAKEGIPINQADLAVVLGAFMVAPMWTIRRMGFRLSRREEQAYQACWRHVGYYLGISPALLIRFYASSFETAETFFSSLSYSIFPSGPPPSDPARTPQYKILSAVANRPPQGHPVSHHIALCRLCLGDKLASQLALPPSSLRSALSADLEVWSGWALVAFGSIYARIGGERGKRWEARRQRFFRKLFELLVVWQLGQRRTLFAWREAAQHADKLGVAEGEDSGLEFGERVGVEYKREWMSLLIEGGVVVGGAFLVVGGLAFAVGKWLLDTCTRLYHIALSSFASLDQFDEFLLAPNLITSISSFALTSHQASGSIPPSRYSLLHYLYAFPKATGGSSPCRGQIGLPHPPTSSYMPPSSAWRTPSRPAPPVTSGTPSASHPTGSASAAFASLFAAPSPSTSSAPAHRTLTSSNSAYSLLSRKMAEMEAQDDDDRMSVRSGRSGMSRLRGGGNSASGESTAKGRSRAPSTASSTRTATVREVSGMEADGDVAMEAADELPSNGNGEAKEEEPSPPIPPGSAKRARLRPPTAVSDAASMRSRRSSWLLSPTANPRTVSTAQATLSTTTADDLMPTMKSKPHRTTSVASIRTTTRGRPPLPAISSSSTVKPARAFSGRSASPSTTRQPQASSSASSSASTSLSTSPNNTAPTSTKRGWFGRAPPAAALGPVSASSTSFTDKPASATPAEVAEPQMLDAPIPPPEPSQASSTAAVPFPSVKSTTSTGAQEVTQEGTVGRSWLSLLSRSKPSHLDLAGEAAKEPDSMAVDELGDGAGAVQDDSDPTTPKAEQTNDTIRGPPASAARPETEGSNTRQPSRLPPSRSSWFTWGRSSSTEAVPGVSDEGDAVLPVEAASAGASEAGPPIRAESADAQPDLKSALTPQPVVHSAETRGWLSLRTLWSAAASVDGMGTADQLVDQRRREVWAMKLAAKNGQRGIEDAPAREAGPSQEAEELPEQDDPVEPLAVSETGAQNLRHKPSGSWSLFSRTPLSSSPVTKSSFSLRAPLLALGVSSSAASTRSRTSSHADTSAPSSPQLRPQSDQGPVKPLTGSIRASSSPRERLPANFDPPLANNLVLPTFDDSFLRPPRSFQPKQSTLSKAVSAVSAYLFHRPPEEAQANLSPLLQAQAAAGIKTEGMMREMAEDPAERLPKVLEAMGEPSRLGRVKRIVTMGVHGWFTSNNMIKSVLGEQTGTSVKFATMMHDAVQAYLESRDIGSFNIQAIALEGQGTVEDRVNKLYSQLTSREEWLQAILRADAVFVATHSQGSVVSTQLLARMLDQGLIVGARTHLLAMCGIAQGPFVYLSQALFAPYFNYVETEPARELFAFQDPESIPSIKFVQSLRIILNAGVKVTCVGSLNDQVVPLYSALFSGVSHPGILRAVYIDSEAFLTSDFLANLCVFSARLRNAGLSDHDLVYHVSEALAGALTGVGHSKIYEEEEIFNLAVRYHFETTALTEAPTHLDTLAAPPPLVMNFNPRDRRNPYLATWSLRGIVEDPQVRQLFGNELVALQEAYETWKPQTKVLKDVKLKLEGIRMIKKTGKL
ncbi:hypothetical protein JCM11641_008012 [Rhodosporidiobolus odoratus]